MSKTENPSNADIQYSMDQAANEKQTLDIGYWTLDKNLAMRLGLRYVKGLREESGQAIVRARSESPFTSIDDLHQRVPELRKDELRKLAAVGALNFIQSSPMSNVQGRSPMSNAQCPMSKTEDQVPAVAECQHPMAHAVDVRQTLDIGHWTLDKQKDIGHWTLDQQAPPLNKSATLNVGRRDALWQVERVARTIGRHPVAYHRPQLNKLGASRAIDIQHVPDGAFIKVGGWVIVRQRPGTAKGFVFLTLEDETGVANIIITPQLFDKNRLVVVDHPFLLIEGALQNQDNVVSVKAKRIHPLSFTVAAAPSHDFH